MLGACTDALVRHLDAAFARIWTLDDERQVLELQASSGMYTHLDGGHAQVPVGKFKIGLIVAERRPHLTNSVVGDPRVGDQAWAKREGMIAFAGYPVLLGDRLLGVMALFARHPLDDSTLEALATVASEVGLGIQRLTAEERLRHALHKVEEADRLKSAFLDNMSHEIRTPLNVILGLNEMIAEELADGQQTTVAPWMAAITRASHRLINTVHSVLDMSKLHVGSFEHHPRPLRLRTVIERQIAEFELLAREKGVQLTSCIEEPGAIVLFDDYCLSKILFSLLDNAMKFTSSGVVSIGVRRDSERRILLEIRDTGVGVDPSFAPRIFEPFSQEEPSSIREFEGAGLGLAVAQRFANLHGSRITVASEKGKGSVFTISFPDPFDVVGARQPA